MQTEDAERLLVVFNREVGDEGMAAHWEDSYIIHLVANWRSGETDCGQPLNGAVLLHKIPIVELLCSRCAEAYAV